MTDDRSPLLPALAAAPPDPSVVCPPCGKCCRYVSVGIDPPSTVGRVSTAIWLLYHRTVSIYQSHEGDWFLLLPTECENLRPDGLCGVYENRPLICRDYDVDGCEGTSDESAEKLRFDTAKELVKWLAKSKPALYDRCEDAGIVPEPIRAERRK